MAGPAILKVQIVVDSSKATAGMATIGRSAEGMAKGGDKAKRSFGDMAKTAGKVVGAAALGGLVLMLKKGAGEQMDFLSGQAQLANGLKSTGNAANTSVKQLEDLASSIQNYSGQTDDSIVASEKLLLTFTNVGNKAGKNNDIFNQATKMTADMAAKMGGDASKYAVQLGKALNDPTKGISALTRVGVTFTAAQKKSIKTMQDSGDTLGAQKVIMGELRKEFGGSAKAAGQTLPGQMQRAQRSFEDISQSLVASLMPVLTKLADFLINNVMPAFKAVMDFIMQHQTIFGILAIGILAVAAAMKVWSIAQIFLNQSMKANVIIGIVSLVVLLVAAVIMAYKHSATFRAIVQGAFKAVAGAARLVASVVTAAFKAIVGAFQAVWNWLTHSPIAAVLLGPWRIAFGAVKALVTGGISGLLGYFKGLLSGLGSILSTVWSVITTPFQKAWGWIKDMWSRELQGWKRIGAWISSVLATVWATITAPFKKAWDWVKGLWSRELQGWKNIASWIGSILSGVWSKITGPFKKAWDWVKALPGRELEGWKNIGSRISSALSSVWSAITAPFKKAWDWIKDHIVSPMKNAFDGMAHAISSAMSGVFGAITAPFKSAWNWIRDHVISPIKGAWNGVANAINSIHVSMTVPSNVVTKAIHLAGKGFTFDPPNVPTLAKGGVVNSATFAMIGEAGREIVTPEALLRSIVQENSSKGTTIINNWNISGAIDPDAVARQIDNLLTRRRRRTDGVRVIGAPA